MNYNTACISLPHFLMHIRSRTTRALVVLLLVIQLDDEVERPPEIRGLVSDPPYGCGSGRNRKRRTIDGTIHKVGKPSAFQSLIWNSHYKRHGEMLFNYRSSNGESKE